jgi:two-component system chemotaxis sensor kinase CheA
MVPIASTFQKMGRVARDISHKNGKQIDFVIEGEETELDKNVIQEISDPLMHMVRNAVDHGLESPEERAATGKPAKGLVKLNAYHQGGNIVIEVQDDGKGLDRDRLLKKGIEKGLVDPTAQLTDQQIFQLILAPGFSTAEKVTDISGRGVGMDVVKRNIENLRGKLDIHSVKGKGTTFIIRLPLTLAVIDGMVVRAGTQKFILPTLLIHQALVPERQQVNSVQGRGQLLNLRGQLYTLISLGNIFNIDDAASDPTEGMVVIVQTESGPLGIILDELVGQQQVVIKSLGESFRHVQGISGGAILGDGTIGLILEPTGLLERYQQALPKQSAA